MRNGFWFKSNIFEITVGEDEETNPDRYGKSLGLWLCSKFIELGYSEAELIAEDWGWCVVCSRGEVFLWVGCGSINVERSRNDYDPEKPPKGHEVVWHVFPEAEISILNPKAYLKKLFGKLSIEEQLNKLECELELIISSESSISLCSEPQ